MVDVVNKITRSRMMSGIRGKDTQPELLLRRALHAMGLRYRLHVPRLPARPDIVLPKHQAVVLVHGCFWHRHGNCRFATTPASNTKFWTEKFRRTVLRDRENLKALRTAGWRTAVVWECALVREGTERAAREIVAWLSTDKPSLEIPAV
jgi:DNA mismatch endonuclease (patch repair protein)